MKQDVPRETTKKTLQFVDDLPNLSTAAIGLSLSQKSRCSAPSQLGSHYAATLYFNALLAQSGDFPKDPSRGDGAG
uniref:F-box domain-containing protein n=1 Tax=Bursaphelenchus xylophilus TaxID=6326 RepID=A0A1I7S6I0_BURXY